MNNIFLCCQVTYVLSIIHLLIYRFSIFQNFHDFEIFAKSVTRVIIEFILQSFHSNGQTPATQLFRIHKKKIKNTK